MQEGIELRKLGITDEDVIEKAIKLKDKNDGLTIRQAGNIMQFEGVTKSELVEPKLRERVKEHVSELVNGDKGLANQILIYLDQRFDLNTNKIEQSIAQEKEEGENYGTQQEEQKIPLNNKQEKETKTHSNKKDKKKDRHPDREVLANRSEDEEENENSRNRFSNYKENQNKHPDKEVFANSSSSKEKDKNSEEETRKDEFKKPDNKIHFHRNNNDEG